MLVDVTDRVSLLGLSHDRLAPPNGHSPPGRSLLSFQRPEGTLGQRYVRSLPSYLLPAFICNAGKFNTVADFLVKTPKDAAKQCGKSKEVAQMDAMMNAISIELFQPPRVLGAAVRDGEAFTTGDTEMDLAFGGGIRSGMVWEICGEPLV